VNAKTLDWHRLLSPAAWKTPGHSAGRTDAPGIAGLEARSRIRRYCPW
jgi:hypothetical protein